MKWAAEFLGPENGNRPERRGESAAASPRRSRGARTPTCNRTREGRPGATRPTCLAARDCAAPKSDACRDLLTNWERTRCRTRREGPRPISAESGIAGPGARRLRIPKDRTRGTKGWYASATSETMGSNTASDAKSRLRGVRNRPSSWRWIGLRLLAGNDDEYPASNERNRCDHNRDNGLENGRYGHTRHHFE